MTITDERVFFPEKVKNETLRARVQLLEGDFILDNTSRAELLSVYRELIERRERERKFIESFEAIRQDASCSAYIGTICDEALLPEPPDA